MTPIGGPLFVLQYLVPHAWPALLMAASKTALVSSAWPADSYCNDWAASVLSCYASSTASVPVSGGGSRRGQGAEMQDMFTRGDAVTCSCGGSRKENHMRSPGGGGSQTHSGPLRVLMSMLSFNSILHSV